MSASDQREAKITIQFTSLWIAGSGKAAAGLDAITWRDQLGCPAMPMTQVKGQLRETASRMFDRHEVERIFGSPPQSTRADLQGDADHRSPLRFRGEVRLPESIRQWFATATDGDSLARLFRRISATKIDDNGVAADKTLRRFEVAIPLMLEGRIQWREMLPPSFDWIGALDRICGSTIAFGRGKADGYGRAIASCVEAEARSA